MLKRLLLTSGLTITLAALAHAGPTTRPTTAPAATQPVNSMCIVQTDHPIDDREILLYKGQWIGFCCPDCKADFQKDPDKYIGNLDQR